MLRITHKSSAISPEETAQIVQPDEVMQRLLKRVLMVRSYIVAATTLISVVTLLTIGLVIVLSIRLRRAELVTMTKMGCSKYRIATILAMQGVLLLVASATIALLLATGTSFLRFELVRLMVQ